MPGDTVKPYVVPCWDCDEISELYIQEVTDWLCEHDMHRVILISRRNIKGAGT